MLCCTYFSRNVSLYKYIGLVIFISFDNTNENNTGTALSRHPIRALDACQDAKASTKWNDRNHCRTFPGAELCLRESIVVWFPFPAIFNKDSKGKGPWIASTRKDGTMLELLLDATGTSWCIGFFSLPCHKKQCTQTHHGKPSPEALIAVLKHAVAAERILWQPSSGWTDQQFILDDPFLSVNVKICKKSFGVRSEFNEETSTAAALKSIHPQHPRRNLRDKPLRYLERLWRAFGELPWLQTGTSVHPIPLGPMRRLSSSSW